MSKTKAFVKDYIAKSYDYPDSQIIIDAKDQQAAEEGTPKQFLKYLSDNIDQQKTVHKIALQKGALTIANKDANLYTGFFSDEQGQIVEKFDAHTLEMIAKTLIVKKLATETDIFRKDEDLEEDRPIKPSSSPVQVRLKVGDVEIEIRKSIKNFIDDFKKARSMDDELLKKAIKSWRRQQRFNSYESDKDAAQAILAEWDSQKESFSQTLFAIRQMSRK
jgi:hypothetical protein